MGGHDATDTGLAYAPVSQAHGHHHNQCIVLLHCSTSISGSIGVSDSLCTGQLSLQNTTTSTTSSEPPHEDFNFKIIAPIYKEKSCIPSHPGWRPTNDA